MRFFLAITLLINSFPIITPTKAIAASVNNSAFTAVPDETPTPTPTPTPDAVLEQAKREALIADELKKKAVADKERAAAEAEKLKTQALPFGTTSNVQIPTGNVQTDAAGWVESQMLAQEAARQITGMLVRSLCKGNVLPGETGPVASTNLNAIPPQAINTLVIHNSNDLTGVELYNAVKGQLVELQNEYKQVNDDANKLLQQSDPKATPGPVTSDTTPQTDSVLPGILAAPGIATGIIKSVAELVNLFRTETRFENKSVTISEDMVVSHIVNRLASNAPDTRGRCSQAIEVYYPALYPARLVESSSTSDLIKTLNEVERSKNLSVLLGERLDARIKELNGFSSKLDDKEKKEKDKTAKDAELAKKKKEEQTVCRKPGSPECRKLRKEIEELEKQIAELVKGIGELNEALKELVNPNVNDQKKIKQVVPKLEEQKTKLKTLVDSTELLSSRLNTPDADTKLTALAQLLRAEKLHGILNNPQTYTLRVAVNANGTTKIKKNLFVDAKVRHSAGANLVYQLFNRNGAVMQGDVMQCYIDYRSANDVYDIVSTKLPVKCNSRSDDPPKNDKSPEAGK